MALEFETGGEVSGSGGTYLDQPGSYHLMVVDTSEAPVKNDGSLYLGAIFGVTVEVLAGTVPGQEGKTKMIVFRHPKPDATEKGRAFVLRKRDRFLMAVALLTPKQVEAKEKVRIEIGECTGRQLVAKFEQDKENDKYVDVSFDEMYHVDDPAVAAIPKSAEALKLIDPKLRWTGEAAKAASANGKSKRATAKPSTPVAPLASPTGVGAGAGVAADSMIDDV